MTPSISPALPLEIITQIVSPLSQSALHACTLTSRAWYEAAIPSLYYEPKITSKNFDIFVAVICPSVNPRTRQNGLAELVHVLDMSQLVHNGRKSLTARLLRRLKDRLIGFVAPQATFGVNAVATLSKCKDLQSLDLSFVSEAIPYRTLFNSIASLRCLQTLYLPRAFHPDHKTRDNEYEAIRQLSREEDKSLNFQLPRGPSPLLEHANKLLNEIPLIDQYQYPPTLRGLHISSSIDSVTLALLVRVPNTLRSLSISRCPRVSVRIFPAFFRILNNYTDLEFLHLGPGLTNCFSTLREPLLQPYSRLRSLTVETPILITCVPMLQKAESSPWPMLQTLTVMARDRTHSMEDFGPVEPNLIYDVIDRGMLPSLRTVRVDSRLGWTGDPDNPRRFLRQDTRDLNELLKALAREDAAECRSSDSTEVSVDEDEAGVVIFHPTAIQR